MALTLDGSISIPLHLLTMKPSNLSDVAPMLAFSLCRGDSLGSAIAKEPFGLLDNFFHNRLGCPWCWWQLGYFAPAEPTGMVSSDFFGRNLSLSMKYRTSLTISVPNNHHLIVCMLRVEGRETYIQEYVHPFIQTLYLHTLFSLTHTLL